jgi:MFS family permease
MTTVQAVCAALLALLVGNLSVAGVAWKHLSVAWQLGLTYADVAVISSCAQFAGPAELVLIKDIVPEGRQDQAFEASQAIQGLAVILGPPVGALLVFSLGAQWALLANALSFVVSYLTVRALPAPPSAGALAARETGYFSREFLAGLGYVAGHRVLRTILVSEALTWLGFGSLQALGHFFLTQNLRAPAGDYGFLGAAFGVGSIVGALLVMVLGQRLGLARILWSALVVSGLFVIVLSHLTSFSLALVAAFLFGMAATAVIVVAGPLVLDGTDRAFVGRVTAAINPLGRLAALISVAVAGFLVSTVLRGYHAYLFGITFDRVDTVFTGLGPLAVAGGIYARFSLRDIIGTGDHALDIRERARVRRPPHSHGPPGRVQGLSPPAAVRCGRRTQTATTRKPPPGTAPS